MNGSVLTPIVTTFPSVGQKGKHNVTYTRYLTTVLFNHSRQKALFVRPYLCKKPVWLRILYFHSN